MKFLKFTLTLLLGTVVIDELSNLIPIEDSDLNGPLAYKASDDTFVYKIYYEKSAPKIVTTIGYALHTLLRSIVGAYIYSNL